MLNKVTFDIVLSLKCHLIIYTALQGYIWHSSVIKKTPN